MTSSRLLSPRGLRWLTGAALAASAVAPLAVQAAKAASPCDASPSKCYSFTLSASPSSPNTGQEATYTGVLANLSKGGQGVQLGAADITLPSAFYGVQPGPVSPAGSEAVSGSVLQLRNLNLVPGGVASFTFRAAAALGGTYAFASEAKQANNFAGTGNDLTAVSADPTVTISAFCTSGLTGYNDYGCSVIDERVGGTTSTDHLDSAGHASVVSAAITYAPIAADGRFVSELRTDLGRNDCPTALSSPCAFSVRVVNKVPAGYTVGRDAVSMVIACGSLCPVGTPQVWYQINEATGTQEPLLPCTPLSATVPSPLSGSYACIDDNGNSTFTVRHITSVNDWRVTNGISI